MYLHLHSVVSSWRYVDGRTSPVDTAFLPFGEVDSMSQPESALPSTERVYTDRLDAAAASVPATAAV